MSVRAIVRNRISQVWSLDIPALEAALNLCQSIRGSDPAMMLQIALDTYNKGKEGGFYDIQTRALISCAHASHLMGDLPTVQHYLSEAETVLTLAENPDYRFLLNKAWGLHYLDVGEFQLAHEHFIQALKLCDITSDMSARYNAMSALGLLFVRLGEYDVALQYYFEAMEGAYREQDTKSLPALLTNIGTAYTSLGDFEKGLECYNQSLEIRDALNDTIGVAVVFKNIGTLYRRQGNFERAIENFEKALEVWRKIGNKKREANALSHIGMTYAELGNLSQGLALTQEAVRYAKQTRSTLEYVHALSRLGSIYEMREEYDKALTSFAESLTLFQRLGIRDYEYRVHKHLADIYEACGEFEKSLHHQKRYMRVREEVQGIETQRAVANAEVRQAVMKVEREKELLRMQAEGVQKEVEFKTKELNTLALHLTQREEMLKKIREEIQPLLRTGEEKTRKSVMEILRHINSVVDKEEKQNIFQEQFEQVYHDFIAQLRAICSELTPTEIRICVLIKLNLSTKQIAEMLFASPLTVKTHRTHIRRKLGLGEGVNLTSLFLAM